MTAAMTASRNSLLRMSRRRGERGFTLIELGIVIAVIAVLAVVVIMGRGFIESSKITKVVEAMGSVRKASATYAGVNGGVLPNAVATGITTLQTRQLLPIPTGALTWTVVPGFTVGPITFFSASATGSNWVQVAVTAPNATGATDVWTSFSQDPNFVCTPGPQCVSTVTAPVGSACTVTVPGGALAENLCFAL